MKISYFAAFIMVLLLLAGAAPASMAVTCNPVELSPCSGAILGNGAPTVACCTKLKQQRPCLCGYLKNPSLQKYVNSPNAKRVANICRAPLPKC